MLARARSQGDSAPGVAGGQERIDLEGIPASGREHEVHRVLGQDGDQGEDRDREAGRDVELCGLGGPGDRERRTDDRESEQQRFEGMGSLEATEPHEERRHGDERGGRQRCALAAGVYVDEVFSHGHRVRVDGRRFGCFRRSVSPAL